MPETRSAESAEYRPYSWALNVILIWVIPAFMNTMGIFILCVGIMGPPENRPPAVIGAGFIAFAMVFWFQQLRKPHRIVVRSDDQIEFVGPLRHTVVAARDIVSIKPCKYQLGLLVVTWAAGKLVLISQFDGFHELLAYIKSVNPGVEIRGC